MTNIAYSLYRIESDPFNLTIADGEAGRGIYAFFSRDIALYKYYRSQSPNARLVKFTVPHLIFLTAPEFRRALIEFCKQEQDNLAAVMGPTFIKRKITLQNYWRNPYNLLSFIRVKFPAADGYVVPHRGPSLPVGWQAVIIRSNNVRVLEENCNSFE